jgi:hypothetical protein
MIFRGKKRYDLKETTRISRTGEGCSTTTLCTADDIHRSCFLDAAVCFVSWRRGPCQGNHFACDSYWIAFKADIFSLDLIGSQSTVGMGGGLFASSCTHHRVCIIPLAVTSQAEKKDTYLYICIYVCVCIYIMYSYNVFMYVYVYICVLLIYRLLNAMEPA